MYKLGITRILLVILFSINISLAQQQPSWEFDGVTGESSKAVYEDEDFSRESTVGPLTHIRWNDVATKCQSFDLKLKDHPQMKDIFDYSDYKPKGKEVKIYLNDLFMNKPEIDLISNRVVIIYFSLTDCTDGPRNYEKVFGIRVKPVNRYPPTIMRNSQKKIQIQEDELVTDILETFTVKDRDMTRGDEMKTLDIVLDSNDQSVKENFRLEIEFKSINDGYEVNVYLNKALNYDIQNAYMLDIKVTDKSENRLNATPPKTAISSLFIDVLDVHNRAPRFLKGCGMTDVNEETPIGTVIAEVNAIDGDTGVSPQGQIKYEINGDVTPVTMYFQVDKENGKLSVIKPPNLKDPALKNQLMLSFDIMAKEYNGKTGKLEETYNNERTTCILTIKDIDNSPPLFKQKQYKATIPEHSFKETSVKVDDVNALSIIDEDMGKNAEYTIELDVSRKIDKDMFQVIPVNGVGETIFSVRVKDNENLEYDDDRLGSDKKVVLTLVAKGTLNSSMTDTATFTIQVTDENDNPPNITSELTAEIMENSAAGTVLMKVEATDKDSGLYGVDGLVFSIPPSSSFTESFEINKKTGEITLKAGNKVDREVQEILYLQIEVMDNEGNSPSNRVTTQLQITVLDDNDNAPIFQVEKFSTILNENDDDFQGSIKLEAKDNDKPNTDNSKVEYHLNDYENFFEVDKDTGDFKLKTKLDFEADEPLYPKHEINPKSKIASRLFNFTAYANDCGVPMQYSKPNATISVQFMDTNDNSPIFVNKTFETEIEEIEPPRKPINVTVEAIDADISPAYNKVYYSLTEDSSSNFLVGRTTGEITVAPGAKLAPEENNDESVFTLTVLATDGLSDNDNEDPCLVTVNVIDVNNQKPIFNENDQQVLLTEFEEENKDPVTLAIFLAKDVDKTHKIEYKINYEESRAETPQFSTVGDDYKWKEVFKLDKTSGVLTATKADREKMKKATLVIEAEDIAADYRFPNQIVKIQRQFIVLDINDHDPEFVNNNGMDKGPKGVQPVYKTEVLEHEERNNLFKIEATDQDENNTITYKLLPYNSDSLTYFTINATTGVVSMKGVDYDAGFHWMNVTVQATDNGVPSRSSFAYVTVEIIDKNDNAPVFNTSINYTVSMKENEPIDTLIITLHATDIDEKDEYGLVHYRFHKDEKDSNMFTLKADTGEFKNREILDYEERPEFKISVEAFDNPNNPGNSNAEQKYVILNLIDVNDNAPEFDKRDKCLWCQEDYTDGRIVDTITAKDRDSPGPNSEIEYLMEPDDHGFFTIDLNGVIRVNKNLTNHPGLYNITITARDKGVDPGPLNTTKTFCIEIADINNNRPEFVTKNQLLFLEEATIGESLEKKELITVEAFDIDLGDNGRVTYMITVRDKSNNKEISNAFIINKDTGLIVVTSDLKKKDVAIYTIEVNAKDNGTPANYADPPLQLEVEIISEEDYLPHFNKNDANYPLNFTENEPKGSEYQTIPEANYREVRSNNKPTAEICYMIIGGDANDFHLDEKTRNLTVARPLDRETHAYHHIIVQAKACNTVNYHSPNYDALLDNPDVINITIRVIDVNDNPPKFILNPFTSGVSTSTKEDRKIITVKAIDPDEGENAVVHYRIYGDIQMQGTENVNINSGDPPFVIDKLTGDISVTFPIAKNMKGHFQFTVLAEDKDFLNDTAQVLIYFFRDDQQIILTVDKPLNEITEDVKLQLTGVLNDITKHFCSVLAVKQYEADTISPIQKYYSNVYVLFVNNETQTVLEPADALTIIHQFNTDIANALPNDLRLVDARPAELVSEKSTGLTDEQLSYILMGISAVLFLALIVAMTLFCLRINSLKRNLKAASATAFGSQESGLNRIGVKSAPNTNQHTVEGSNPVWNHKDEIVYNDDRSIYGSETASMKSDDDDVEVGLDDTIEQPNESKINPAFEDHEYETENGTTFTGEQASDEGNKEDEKMSKMYKKNTINTLRQIDSDWRRRNTEGELQIDSIRSKKNSMMNIFDLPDRRRPSTFIAPIPTSEL